MIKNGRVVLQPFNTRDNELGGFNNFMTWQEDERADAIDRICAKAKNMWQHGTDPRYYVSTLFMQEDIDMDSLTDEELAKINRACC